MQARKLQDPAWASLEVRGFQYRCTVPCKRSQGKTELYRKSDLSASGNRHDPTRLPWVTKAKQTSLIYECIAASHRASEATRNVYHSFEPWLQLKSRSALTLRKRKENSHISCHVRLAKHCWGGWVHEEWWAELSWPSNESLSHPTGSGTHGLSGRWAAIPRHPYVCSEKSSAVIALPVQGEGLGVWYCFPHDWLLHLFTWSHGWTPGNSGGTKEYHTGMSDVCSCLRSLTRLPLHHQGVTEGRQ